MNVEKVVYAPMKPVPMTGRASRPCGNCSISMISKNPRTKLPEMLMTKVPQGNRPVSVGKPSEMA